MSKCEVCNKEIDMMCQYDNFHHAFACKLEIEIESLKQDKAKLLKEAVEKIKGSCQYDESWIEQDKLKANYYEGDPCIERYKSLSSFLNKPEIIKLKEGV